MYIFKVDVKEEVLENDQSSQTYLLDQLRIAK